MSFCAPVAEAATVPTPGKVPLQCPVDGWGNGLETGSHQRSLLALAFRESGTAGWVEQWQVEGTS
jgi:hypothetical protein